MSQPTQVPLVAVACGGTGGHLFPGIAVAEALMQRGVEVSLFVSTKEVDRRAVAQFTRGTVEPVEAVGLDARRPWNFAVGLVRSWRRIGFSFKCRRPQAVLAMGGFTSVAPILRARRLGLPGFLHESNAVPGRATRWLSRFAQTVFLGFAEAGSKVRCRRVLVYGTPVRSSFRRRNAAGCREELGLAPERPTLVVTGGSQGARALNDLVLGALPAWRRDCPELQFVHLTGSLDVERTEMAYKRCSARAHVRAFSLEMDRVLGAADLVISRAGASSLAELAALRLPSILIPYPQATDDHQLHNAHAVARGGGALVLQQSRTTSDALAREVAALLARCDVRRSMGEALGEWHRPQAAGLIAEVIVREIGLGDKANASAWPAMAAEGEVRA